MTDDYRKTEDELIEEIEELRHRVADLRRCAEAHDRIQEKLGSGENAQREFGADLTRLIEITNELSLVGSPDELCYRAVMLARHRLRFDRIGIWFRSETPDTVVGTFGVDEDGNICDERGKRVKLDPASPEGRVMLSSEPLVLVEAPVKQGRKGKPLDQGTQVFCAIWDGKKVIGHVRTDNRCSEDGVTRYQCELLRLFGAALGYLYTRKRAEREREKVIAQLQDALAKIKTLRGLLPICARCKKIRDDKGYWYRIEKYVSEHSEAEFSHSLCPDCTKQLYPGLSLSTE